MFSLDFSFQAHLCPRLCKSKQFRSPGEIVCHLSKHGIDDVLDDSSEPSSLGSIVEMAQAEVLLNNVAFFGNLFVSFFRGVDSLLCKRYCVSAFVCKRIELVLKAN